MTREQLYKEPEGWTRWKHCNGKWFTTSPDYHSLEGGYVLEAYTDTNDHDHIKLISYKSRGTGPKLISSIDDAFIIEEFDFYTGLQANNYIETYITNFRDESELSADTCGDTVIKYCFNNLQKATELIGEVIVSYSFTKSGKYCRKLTVELETKNAQHHKCLDKINRCFKKFQDVRD